MSAKKRSFNKLSLAAAVVCMLSISAGLIHGQTTSSHVVGVPDDWTHHHHIFSNPGTYEQAMAKGTYSQWIKLQYDTRYILQQMKRNRTSAGGFSPPMTTPLQAPTSIIGGPKPTLTPLKRDWSMNMGAGATVGAGQYPAKWSFSSTTANCGNAATPDYVVFNTGLAGSSTQASILAYDNLYATTCTGTVPSVYWQYNTNAGTVVTSPVLSLDGSQVAFVESVGAAANLVLLKPLTGASAVGCVVQLASGGYTVSASLTSASKNVNASAACFTAADVGASVSGTGIAAGTTITAVTSTTKIAISIAATVTGTQTLTITDTATHGDVSNANYRSCAAPCMTSITFGATTPYLGTSSIPNDTHSSPYYDYTNDAIYVGENNGFVHQFTGIFNGTAAENYTNAGSETGTGWPVWVSAVAVSNPVYDPVSGNVFVGPNQIGANNGGKFHRIPAGGGASNVINTATLALGGAAGSVGFADGPIVDSVAGMLYVFVGDNSGGNAAVYQLSTTFASGAAPTASALGTGSISIDVYSGMFDNAYFSSSNPSMPTGNLYVCGNPGGNATLYQVPITNNVLGTAHTGPTLTTAIATCSSVLEVYNSNASNGPFDWIYLGLENNGSPSGCGGGGCVMNFIVTAWQASNAYALSQEILDSNLNIQKVTKAGTSGGTPPGTWNTSGTTTDGTVTWTYQGAMSASANSTANAEAGGTSGIIIDNIVNSAGASQIYFSTLSNETCLTSGGTGGCAIQTSQAAP